MLICDCGYLLEKCFLLVMGVILIVPYRAFAVLHVIKVMVAIVVGLPSSEEEPCLLEGCVYKLTNEMSSVLHMERIMTNYASYLQMEQIQFVINILFDLLCYIDIDIFSMTPICMLINVFGS